MKKGSSKVNGIYKRGDRWRVQKFNRYIGTYNTYDEALKASKREEQEQEIFHHTSRYLESKQWLKEHGLLPQ